MSHEMRRSSAFTLVELLIVLAIIAIMAAIVVPKFSGAADTARSANIQSQLHTARSQLEVWRFDHGDVYPTLAQMQAGADDWGVFTSKTDADGVLNPTGEFGPYFARPPANPFTSSSRVVAAGAADPSVGWTYDQTTGELKAVLPSNINPAEVELGPHDYEQL